MGAEVLTSMCGCMNSKPQAGEYAFESYRKIPFIGPIGSFLSNFNNNKGQGVMSNFSNIMGTIGNNKSIIPSFPNSGDIPSPGGFNLANLISNLPLNVMKANENILDLNNDVLVKKIKKSSYEQLKAKLGAGDKFTDDQFPPQMSSLGNLANGKANEITWKRIGEIIDGPIFVSDKIEPNDILQGALGNCYFLSAISAVAEADFRIKNIFPNLQINPNGIYMARILHNGVYQQVIVDDYFPLNKNGGINFAKPAGGKEIWVMVLQKCYAKLYGSYAVVVGGLPIQALHAITSAPVLNRSLNNDVPKMQEAWKQMVQLYHKGALICCGTKSDPSIEGFGFVKSHAYTILGVFEQPYRLIKIRNPWGHKEWKGRAADSDKNFWQQITPAHKQKMGYQDNQRKEDSDGIFFMIWEDFLKYFQLVNYCKINDSASYNFVASNFEHLVPKLFDFEIGAATDHLNLTSFALTQENNRGKGQEAQKRGYSRSFMILGKLNPQTNKYSYVNSNSNKSFPDNFLEVQDIQAGKYRLYARYIWNNGKGINTGVVSTYSPAKITINQSKDSTSEFLNQVFYDHAVKNTNNKKVIDGNDWMCNDILLAKGGFGYFAVNLDENSRNKLSVSAEQAQYTAKQLELIEPRKGTGKILQQVRPGNHFIMVFNLAVEKFPQSLTLPQPKVARME